MLLTFEAQSFASAASSLEINVDNPTVVMIEEEEYYIDDSMPKSTTYMLMLKSAKNTKL